MSELKKQLELLSNPEQATVFPFRRLTDAQEQILKTEYLKNKSIEDLIRETGIGGKTIRNALHRTGTKKRTKSQAISLYYQTEAGIKKGIAHSYKIRKYSVNENFFEQPLNSLSAYVLGFWLSDGHIEGKNQLIFDQMEKEILIKIKKVMCAENPIYNKGKKGFRLLVSSKKLCEDIQRMCSFDVTKPKSISADYPLIPNDLDSHFIRGVFDGDGGLWRSKDGQLQLSLTGTEKLNTEIQKRFIKNCCASKTKLNDRGVFCQLSYCGNIQVPRILNWLYKDAIIYIERKKNFFWGVIK